MSNVLTSRDTATQFRMALSKLSDARFFIQKLVDAEKAEPLLLRQLACLVDDLEEDREAFQDWHKGI